ncbi:uncharacterized protein LTR77_004910 [Saxophila tyrrhenica]|uniref:Uncharacterized protein n=1 Tax=Saxophila tyrrhenica TaxID=1690608 RepID=A0AAV9PB74_9PEZI|nr:hypothetical protein LTR77_004910 [Saxophila tyrrhenica]
MATTRDVSPIGTSKFEKPFTPPSATTTPTTSPTDPTPQNLPFSRYHAAHASTASTTDTYSTAPTTATTILDEVLEKASWDADPTGMHARSRRDSALLEGHFVEEIHQQDGLEDGWSDTTRSNSDLASDALPDRATLAAVQEFPIFDADGRQTTFGSLFDPENVIHQRQLIVFVRYWYCPACTAYLESLTEGISSEDYYNIPIPTSITIIGCGQPDLINHYKQFTGCPFTMYADPTRTLFKRLGMGLSMNLGKRKPEYMAKGLLGASGDEFRILRKSLQEPEGLRKRDLLRGGHPMQVGGEFLFEGGAAVWCHRMKDYRGHSEIGVLRRLVGLDE